MRLPGPIGEVERSCRDAWAGISFACRSQRNLPIHLALGLTAVVAGLALDFSRLEMVIVVLTVSLVLVAEMINTSLEMALNLVEARQHPFVRAAKDIAAGGVLLAALGSLVVAALLFGPKLLSLVGRGG